MTRTVSVPSLQLALLLLALLLAGTTSCSIKKMATKSVANSLTSGPDVFGTDDDPQLIREAIPFGLKTMESLLQTLPQHRGLLLSLMHAFILGSDPEIGRAARRGFLEVYKFLRFEAGFSPAEADIFLAHGMMMNTMVGLRMADEYANGDPCAIDLLETAMPSKLDVLLDASAKSKPA